MLGRRARIGLIVPMDNVVIEPEFYLRGLEGITYHTVRLSTKERWVMPEQAVLLAPTLAEAGVDLIVYACAESSFLGGSLESRLVADEITAATGLPCVTAVAAMIEALRRLEVRRLSAVAPYTAARTQLMQEVLQNYGLETVNCVHRDFNEDVGDRREWFQVNRQPPAQAYKMAREADRPSAQGILIAATHFQTLDIIQSLEEELGKPVVSSNQAILWLALRTLGIHDTVSGLGRLLREL